MKDGYNLDLEQSKIEERLDEIVAEMNKIPHVPMNLDNWISSLSKSEKDFKLSDLEKLFKISREYDNLIDKKIENNRSIKILAIDSLVEKIREVLKENG